MRTGFQISSLVPRGLAFDGVSDSLDSIILTLRSATAAAECPLCGMLSRRIHSRYLRQVADLPCAGREARIRMITRRFVCEVAHRRRQIFAERFGDDVVPIRARRYGAAGKHCSSFGLGTRRKTGSWLCPATRQSYVIWSEGGPSVPHPGCRGRLHP
jgi:hypothetical protein